jgi:adenylate cyclase
MATVPDVIFKEVDYVRVRGKGNATRIFEPLCLTENVTKTILDNLAIHQRALACYYRGEWDQAEFLFTKLRDNHFNHPYCELLLERIVRYRRLPPPMDWLGVTNYSRRPTD